jgi:regulator of RNase E activity RraA
LLFGQTISKDELVFLTSAWKGERFEDGRPKISDSLLQRAKHIMIDDAWTVLRNEGYLNQFEGGWKTVNDTPMTGRAFTAMYMPSRPDVEKNIKERGAKEGRKGNTNSWPIDKLSKGDLYVADAFGKISGGPIMGATLANSIYSKSGNGVVFDGASRDLQEIKNIKGFNAYVRDFHPSFTEEMVLMGLNTAIRIGNVMVLPGDLTTWIQFVLQQWPQAGYLLGRGDSELFEVEDIFTKAPSVGAFKAVQQTCAPGYAKMLLIFAEQSPGLPVLPSPSGSPINPNVPPTPA